MAFIYRKKFYLSFQLQKKMAFFLKLKSVNRLVKVILIKETMQNIS